MTSLGHAKGIQTDDVGYIKDRTKMPHPLGIYDVDILPDPKKFKGSLYAKTWMYFGTNKTLKGATNITKYRDTILDELGAKSKYRVVEATTGKILFMGVVAK